MSSTAPIAVLGGGSGAHAMVAYLAHRSVPVRWWLRDPEQVAAISAAGGVQAIGVLEGFFSVHWVGNDLAEALDGVKTLMIIVPAQAHAELADSCAPLLSSGTTTVLHPGRTAGARMFQQALSRAGAEEGITIGETQSLVFTCRRIAPGVVDLLKIKNYGEWAFLGAAMPKETERILAWLFPQVQRVGSTLRTGLGNIGAMLHPAPVLLNIGRIESPHSQFRHYYEGITPTIARFIEHLDRERLQIASVYGEQVLDIVEWHRRCYGMSREGLYETLHINERYASLAAPETLRHRYISEDVPTGIVPMIALAEAAGIEVPNLRAVWEMTRLVIDDDFAPACRTASRMGIDGATPTQIQAWFRGEHDQRK